MIEDTISKQCGTALAKSINYDRLHALHSKTLVLNSELAGQLLVMKGLDAERVELVAANAVLASEIERRWPVLSVVALAVGVAVLAVGSGVVVGLVAF